MLCFNENIIRKSQKCTAVRIHLVSKALKTFLYYLFGNINILQGQYYWWVTWLQLIGLTTRWWVAIPNRWFGSNNIRTILHASFIVSGHPLVQSPIFALWSPWWYACWLPMGKMFDRKSHAVTSIFMLPDWWVLCEVTFSFKSFVLMWPWHSQDSALCCSGIWPKLFVCCRCHFLQADADICQCQCEFIFLQWSSISHSIRQNTSYQACVRSLV